MNRLLIASSVTAAALVLASVPAAVGLVGNPSFSHQLPVNVPAGAEQISFARDGAVSTIAPTPSATDDHGGQTRSAEPGDDRGDDLTSAHPSSTVSSSAHHDEPGDRHGSGTQVEPGDDHGGSGRGN